MRRPILLDVSALAAFNANVATFNVGFGQSAAGTLALSNTANSLLATLVNIGHSNGSNGGNGACTLGNGTNVFATDTLNIGLSKTNGTLAFASQTPGPGTFTLGNRAGNGGVALTVGSNNGTGTGAQPLGTLDLRGHLSNVTAGTVTLGLANSGTAGGFASGILNFDTGTFTCTALNIGQKTGTQNGSPTATALNLSGGTFTCSGTTAISASTATATASSITSALNVSGGTFSTLGLTGATSTGATTAICHQRDFECHCHRRNADDRKLCRCGKNQYQYRC